jgi:hypothetical protein
MLMLLLTVIHVPALPISPAVDVLARIAKPVVDKPNARQPEHLREHSAVVDAFHHVGDIFPPPRTLPLQNTPP